MTVQDAALQAFTAHDLPDGMEPGLEATFVYDPPNFSWPGGAHICVVEVDTETGEVELGRYIAVDEIGNVINPTIVDGQIHGGVTQGIAQALWEEAIYDDDGNLTTGSMISYLVPSAAETIDYELDRVERAEPDEPARRQGRGGDGHDRLDAGGDQRDRRRALAVRRHRRRDARQARASLARDPGRGCEVIPAQVRLRGRRVRRPRDRAPRLGPGREAARGRPLAPPAHAAPPRAARAARRHRPRLRPLLRARGRRRDRRSARSRATATSRQSELLRGRVPDPRRTRPGWSATRRSATAGRSAARSRTATRPPTRRRSCSRSTPSSSCAGRAASGGCSVAESFGGFLQTALDPAGGADRDPRPEDRCRRLGLPEVPPAGPGLGDGRPSRPCA